MIDLPAGFNISPEWIALRRVLVARIDHLRDTLEAQHDHETTAAYRGRIAELRRLIADVEPEITTETDSSDGPSRY